MFFVALPICRDGQADENVSKNSRNDEENKYRCDPVVRIICRATLIHCQFGHTTHIDVDIRSTTIYLESSQVLKITSVNIKYFF